MSAKIARYCGMALMIFNALAFAEVREGVDFQRIVPEQAPSIEGKIEVVELFWYGCPHCHRFEPFIERWQKSAPKDMALVRMPAIFREDWVIHARAFYTAEALGMLEKIHGALFNAIHAHKRKLDTEEALQAFFKEQGVSEEDFSKAWRSFSVDAKVRRAREMTRRYGAQATPALVIAGKYRVDGTICNCNFSEQLQIAEALADKERNAAGQ